MSYKKEDQLPKPSKPQIKVRLEANRELNKQEWWKNTHVCEVCEVNRWPLQPMHRHKSIWYKHRQDKLHDKKQVIKACQSCHQFLESKRKMTEAVFMYLRGLENE